MAEKKEKQYVSDNARLIAEWNWEKNNELGFDPNKLTCGSGKKVWWKCSDGHEWEMRIIDRNRGQGCPYCAGRYAVKGKNDLQTVNPILANEWNYDRNNGLTPMDVLPNSGKKVWWKCKKGHEWQARIESRNKGAECPDCMSEQQTSFPEYVFVYYLKKYGVDVVHSYREQGYELDVYIPSKKIAIEYDGYFWHKDKTEKDLEKNQKCSRDGIKLYRIREELPPLNDSSIDYVIQKGKKQLEKTVVKILRAITKSDIDIDLERDAINIENLREYSEKENSILISNPKIAKEWNYEKNLKLEPENFKPNSEKKIWWKCNNGHEWKAAIHSRNSGKGCPYCSGRYVIKGENDLQTVNPILAKEWHLEKNGNLQPDCFSVNSHKKVWWRCYKRHEWQSRIADRNKGQGCPYCAGKKISEGYNDLQTINPALAKEWNYKKNNRLAPVDVASNSHKTVWWECIHGHEWQASIDSRNRGNGCPFCAGQKVLKGYNDLQTINPILAKEWGHENNNGLTPMDVSPNSHKKVWWKCNQGHEWQAIIANRNKGRGCPECAKQKRKKKDT